MSILTLFGFRSAIYGRVSIFYCMKHIIRFSFSLFLVAAFILPFSLHHPAYAVSAVSAAPEYTPIIPRSSPDLLYDYAIQLLHSGETVKAAPIFAALGSYQCSADYLKYCLNRIDEENMSLPSIFEGIQSSTAIGAGTWYNLREAVVYIPDDVNSETRSVLYYPGGNGGIMEYGVPALFTYSVRTYLSEYSPSSIMVFWRSSGGNELFPTIEDSYQVLESIAREYNIAIHDLVLAGSSNGGYAAVKAAAYFLEAHGVPTSRVLVYDMGMSFAASILPSAEEYQNIARVGTELFLFDQKDINYQHPKLKKMTDNGVEVQLIYCTKDEHCHITWDAFSLGTLSWATGELDHISEEAYTFAERES